MHLDNSPGVVQHTDDCALRSEMGSIFCVGDRLTDRVGSRIPDRTVSKQFTDQIKAVPVLAWTKLVKVVASCQSKAAVFGIHGFHRCYLFRYLSNEFAGLKET